MDRLYLLIDSCTHIGCDIIDELARMTSTGFQFTHSRGVRQEYCLQMLLRDHFNSRTHVGCDLYRSNDKSNRSIFQFTHSRGVRLSRRCKKPGPDGFQFTRPTRGATANPAFKSPTRSAVSIIILKFKRNCQRLNSRITLFTHFPVQPP